MAANKYKIIDWCGGEGVEGLYPHPSNLSVTKFQRRGSKSVQKVLEEAKFQTYDR